jgi:hypothetical protein
MVASIVTDNVNNIPLLGNKLQTHLPTIFTRQASFFLSFFLSQIMMEAMILVTNEESMSSNEEL